MKKRKVKSENHSEKNGKQTNLRFRGGTKGIKALLMVLSLAYLLEAEALMCRRCLSVNNPLSCTRSVTCAIDEQCFTQKMSDSGTTTYTLGCQKVVICEINNNRVNIGWNEKYFGEDAESAKKDLACNKCCSTDNCNQYLCVNIEKQRSMFQNYAPTSSDIYVRLIYDTNAYGGTVQVFYDGEWETICNDHWSPGNSQVVCKMLGYRGNDAEAVSSGMFKPDSTERTLLEENECQGSESSLSQCSRYSWLATDCLHRDETKALCSSATLEDDIMFLLDTKLRLFVRMNLRTQSYTLIPLLKVYAPNAFDYDSSLGRIYFADVRYLQILSMMYDGTDIRLLRQLNSERYFGQTGGVNPKIETAYYDGSNRRTLANTNLRWPNSITIDYNENRLYFTDGGKGTIESMGYQGNDRRVIYSQQSLHLHALEVSGNYIYFTFGSQSVPMRINKDGTGLSYVGAPSFLRLSEIRIHKYGTDFTGSVTPSPSHFHPSHMFVRLIGLNDSTAGRVEIYGNGQWGTICDDTWDDNDAKVVCHMMGFDRSKAKSSGWGLQGKGKGIISLDSVNCTGYEDHIANCGISPSMWAVHDCSHSEDAGVLCEPPLQVGQTDSKIDNFVVFCHLLTGNIVRMDINTFSYTTIPLASSPKPVAIAFDPNDQQIYSSELYSSSSEIRITNHRGSNVYSLPGIPPGSITVHVACLA